MQNPAHYYSSKRVSSNLTRNKQRNLIMRNAASRISKYENDNTINCSSTNETGKKQSDDNVHSSRRDCNHNRWRRSLRLHADSYLHTRCNHRYQRKSDYRMERDIHPRVLEPKSQTLTD